MKKLLLAIAMIAITTTSFAQKSEREQKREARQQATEAQMKAALASQNFTFTPYFFTPPYQSSMPLTYGPANYVEVYPSNLSLMLPFTVGTPNPMPNIRKLTLDNVKYTYSVKLSDNGRYIVIINLVNVSNINVGPNLQLQNINLTLHFDISAISGQTFLTVSPDFGPSTSYSGTVTAN